MMPLRASKRAAYPASVVISSLLMAGYTGVADCQTSRYRSVSTRTASVQITGYANWYSDLEPICAYQQSREGVVSASPLGCTFTTYDPQTDGCNNSWFPFTLNITLLSNDANWFKDAAGPEYTRVFVARPYTDGGLNTATGDEAYGPSNANACMYSRIKSNSDVEPITYFHGSVPADLDCSSGTKSYAGCPFTCNLNEGCDMGYGRTQNNFYVTAYRSNPNGQATSDTLFDQYGANSATGVPAGDWTYQASSDGYYTVMRRNNFTSDSLKIRRGENRRNTYIEAWALMQATGYYNREIGVVGRHYDADNYFVFMVREYGGDYARLQRYYGGTYGTIAYTNPSIDVTVWNKLGLKINDNGSYVNGAFVPNGYCAMSGILNGSTVVSTSSTYCGFAPYGGYGLFSYYNSSAQFWSVTAYPCDGTGLCKL